MEKYILATSFYQFKGIIDRIFNTKSIELSYGAYITNYIESIKWKRTNKNWSYYLPNK